MRPWLPPARPKGTLGLRLIVVELPGWKPEPPLCTVETEKLAGLAPGIDGHPGYAEQVRESFGREHVVLGKDFSYAFLPTLPRLTQRSLKILVGLTCLLDPVCILACIWLFLYESYRLRSGLRVNVDAKADSLPSLLAKPNGLDILPDERLLEVRLSGELR